MGATTLEADPIDFLDDEEGDLAFVDDLAFSSGAAAARQQVKAEVQLARGEIFDNTADGVPWYGDANGNEAILGETYARAEARMRAELRLAILRAPNVAGVDRLDLTFDARTRIVSGEWEATTRFGDTIGGTFAEEV